MGKDSDDFVVGPSTPAPDAAEMPPGGKVTTMGAHTEALKNQLKVATVKSHSTGMEFTLHCDEPPTMGGDDAHPQPLAYVAAGVGF